MRLSTERPLLGIMVTELQRERELPFASADFYRHLTSVGASRGLNVIVFSPNRIDWQQLTVRGYSYVKETKKWVSKLFPLPSLIYDRCFFSSKSSYEQYRSYARKLHELPHIRFLGYGLGGKWDVGQMLLRDSAIRAYLPETALLASGSDLRNWLQTRDDVFLKPQGGSQGKGALHLRKVNSANGSCLFHIKGRNGQNRSFERSFPNWNACWHWLRRQIGSRPYLLQEYLHLHSSDGMAYDVRSLMQKNGHGLWENTGMAVRIGKPGSITSNLHGGGSAEEAAGFLAREFGDAKAGELLATLGMLSARIPPLLENHHGRLAELGIDLGIDTSGRVWVLEVNSKPGRTIFARLHNERARVKSMANPIYYAEFLLHKKLG
ncbi:YheC/YheD family protein [Paenibacillus sp. GCM10023248]|uniref:YheC/YheD family endospore coat-associated protein n=1 Tax=Bacillales TaxID=1385 RepID=UPI002379DEB1|nr:MULTISPECIES: YheC/YheD family protein [Bacillales]MDD9265933.1 YheC/YheD family protein [Paenibacillus sp. MAHUQ-63]MDR6879171.1 glutathione synthase/RimK-type ligase-like ATP-grasp enzyme [Bacillus sp. 3255]